MVGLDVANVEIGVRFSVATPRLLNSEVEYFHGKEEVLGSNPRVGSLYILSKKGKMKMIVWVVEVRERFHEGQVLHDSTVMYIASTKELAEEYIKRNPTPCSADDWHWWVGGEAVDEDDPVREIIQRTYNPDGTPRCEWSNENAVS